MQNINWLQVLIGFLSGGAFGAIIKQYFDNRRNRIQPIGHSIEVKSIYDSGENRLIDSQIILTGITKDFKFSKLYTGTIELINTGLSDFSEFDFGITCPTNIKFIQVKTISTDRHHNAELTSYPSLEHQINSFDVVLKPFNRKDYYKFDILLTTDNSRITEDNIEISSPKPIRWVKLSSTSEAILNIANKTLIEILASSLSKIIRI